MPDLLEDKTTLSSLPAEMTRLASQRPEHKAVRAMYGVGETIATQFLTEIGDVRHFQRHSSIVGFAGVDSGADECDKHSARSVPAGFTTSAQNILSNCLYIP